MPVVLDCTLLLVLACRQLVSQDPRGEAGGGGDDRRLTGRV